MNGFVSRVSSLRYAFAVIFALLGFAVIILATLKMGGIDDAYITYVFARNLAEGHGITWSVGGPPVYGSTTFAYTVLLAVAGYLGLDIPTASIVLGAIFWSACYIVLFWAFERRIGWLPSLLIVLLGAVSLHAVRLSYGMETGLYTFLVISSFALYANKRLFLAAITSGLLIMTRLDGALVPIMMLFHFLLTSPLSIKERLMTIGRVMWPTALLLSIWAIFLYLYFGSLLPNSFLAKSQHDASASGLFNPRFYLDIFLPYMTAAGYVLMSAFFLIVILGVGKALINWRDPIHLLFLWIPAYISLFLLETMPNMGWYYAPTIPAIFAAFLYAGSNLYRYIVSHYQDVQRYSFPIAMLLAQGVALVVLAVITVNAYQSFQQIRADPLGEQYYQNEAHRKAIAAILKDMRARGIEKTSVMANEVGYLGYFVPGIIHDILGLVSPEVVKHGGAENPLYILETYKPDYAVIPATNLYPPTGPIYQSFRFQTNYVPIFSLARPYGGNYEVFRKEPRRLRSTWSMDLSKVPSLAHQIDVVHKEDGFLATRSRGNDPYLVFDDLGAPDGPGRLLKVEVSSSSQGVSQVFFDFGQGVSEENSTQFLLRKGNQEFGTYLPSEAPLMALRIDPLGSPGEVEIRELSLWASKPAPDT